MTLCEPSNERSGPRVVDEHVQAAEISASTLDGSRPTGGIKKVKRHPG
jgi:hypothetical protein